MLASSHAHAFLRNDDDLPYLLRALHNVHLANGPAKSSRYATSSSADNFELQERGSLEHEAVLETREVYSAVASLPEHLRAMLVAVDVAGLSYRETATALRLPAGTVMSRLYRARQQAARKLTG